METAIKQGKTADELLTAIRKFQDKAQDRAREVWTRKIEDPEEVDQLSFDDDFPPKEEKTEPVKPELPEPKPRRSNAIFEDVGLFCAEMSAPPQLVDGVLEEDSVVALVGPPNCGKSFLALDWACSIATGLSWQGRTVAEGPVVYLAGEGRPGLQRRLSAWQEQFGIISPHRMQISTKGADLTDLESVQAIARSLEKITEKNGEEPKLIVIDTVARHFGESDENSTRDMNKFIGLLDELRRIWSCAILLVHHSGKDAARGARGSTALRGAVDVEYALGSTEGVMTLSCTKSKDSAIPDAITMELREVTLENVVKPDGSPVTTCVLQGAEQAPRMKGGLSGNALLFWESFLEVERAARLQSENAPTWFLVKAVNSICSKKGVSRSVLSNIRNNYKGLFGELHSLLKFQEDYVARASSIDVQPDVQLESI